ncbi:hypothetical protein [Methylobacterium sp. ID0610]|uniref:hypothetical protein n=1 Tax=Methylobacterium carpenticola TaxID=3344827 RepID=UPI0036770582
MAIVMMVAAVVATRFMANQGRATLQHAAAAALRVVAEPETTGTLAALGDLRLDPCAVRAAP